MTKLSVNINKFATLRNARGGNNPDIVKAAIDCQRFGAQGITVHPRPDERHIRYQDVLDILPHITTELNIEGNPQQRFLRLIEQVKPTQATLVPDTDDVLTSNTGWDTLRYQNFLQETIAGIQAIGTRVSIFINPEPRLIEAAAKTGTDRIEFYTGPFAYLYHQNPEKAIQDYRECAILANQLGLGINAGHDLDLHNLQFFKAQIPQLLEVSIGHALICDAIYLGLENTIQLYLQRLQDQ